MKNKYVIITACSGFPNGYGAASILRKYAKGFLENNLELHIMLLRPSESSESILNTEIAGEFCGAAYEYVCRENITSKSILKRLFVYARGILNAVKYIWINKNKIKAVYYYTPEHYNSVAIIGKICKIIKIPYIGIKTESSFINGKSKNDIHYVNNERRIYAVFNKIIAISKYIKVQLEDFGYKNKVDIVPILLDTKMYEKVSKREKTKEIIYVGSLGHDAEIKNLFNIVNITVKSHPDWKFVIIGNTFDLSEENKKISNSVVSFEKVAERLINASIMILPRSRQEYSAAGFPIKLGEYLLTGSPVIVTDVGEIKSYIKDNEEAYFVEPDNPVAFAEKINYVIEHYDEALEVGKRGKEKAIAEFDAVKLCKKMADI